MSDSAFREGGLRATHRVRANGLDHHVVEWAPAPGADVAGTAVLLHGYMDAAATWEKVARLLSNAGLRVVAPDMRGFGESARAPEGSYYHFPDYVADLAGLIDSLGAPAPLLLVGHSMGGTIATLFTGAFPERVTKLAVLEGLGPPDGNLASLPGRIRNWVEQSRDARARPERAMGSVEDAFRRLAANHPNVVPAELREKVLHLVRELGDGRVGWRADPLHKTSSPMPFFAEGYMACARQITCPVLYVSGGPEGFHVEDEEERLLAFKSLERVLLSRAGHMMHWTDPDGLAEALVAFWKRPSADA